MTTLWQSRHTESKWPMGSLGRHPDDLPIDRRYWKPREEAEPEGRASRRYLLRSLRHSASPSRLSLHSTYSSQHIPHARVLFIVQMPHLNASPMRPEAVSILLTAVAPEPTTVPGTQWVGPGCSLNGRMNIPAAVCREAWSATPDGGRGRTGNFPPLSVR